MIEKIKPWRNKQYLAWVHERPCCYCGHPGPSDPHHVIGLGFGGMGTKASDHLAVPLCREHHNQLHEGRIEKDFQLAWLFKTLDAAFSEGILHG